MGQAWRRRISRQLRRHVAPLSESSLTTSRNLMTMSIMTIESVAAFRGFNRFYTNLIGVLRAVTDTDRRRLMGAMRVIEAILGGGTASAPTVVLRAPGPGDLGWVVQRHGALYAMEYGWNGDFEAMVARIVADYADSHDPR